MPEATTETTVELNGVRLYTRRVGHGPPVVVLHGGPGAHHDYLLPQYDHLTEGGRALLYYDQRGGGRSPVPRDIPVGWREHVVDLEALRGHWGLDHLTVIGYSWGGLLALLYALEHPDRIARLALVSSAPVTATGGRICNSKLLRTNVATRCETTTAPAGARPESRVATVAAEP